MSTTLSTQSLKPLLDTLAQSNANYARVYPGERIDRQPIHTIYGGAQLFRRDSAARLGELALSSLRDYAPDFASFARAIGLTGCESLPDSAAKAAVIAEQFATNRASAAKANPAAALAIEVYERVLEKLKREPVEDFRIDFEDGYGTRPDAEEDACAIAAAAEVAAGMAAKSLPPFVGIRIKNFGPDTHARGIRTLDLFLTALSGHTGGKLPDNFVVMLPKLVSAQQVTTLVDIFELFENAGKFAKGSLKMEFMVETTPSVFDANGKCPLVEFVTASRGRCIAGALGVYDYTAACGITAQQQKIDHRACDFVRHVMQVALAPTGIYLSDGATNIMPAAPHRAEGGAALSGQLQAENRAAVHAAWKLHFEHVRRSLAHGYYQGWDLNPAQLPTRYAAVYSYFLEYLPEATHRLRNFVDKAARATLVGGAAGGVFDDAATAQGLMTFFIQGLRRRAITQQEAAATGLSNDEIALRSFVEILKKRGRV